METLFHVHFFSFVETVYEWEEWMWRMSERSGSGQYLKRIRFSFPKKS